MLCRTASRCRGHRGVSEGNSLLSGERRRGLQICEMLDVLWQRLDSLLMVGIESILVFVFLGRAELRDRHDRDCFSLGVVDLGNEAVRNAEIHIIYGVINEGD